MKTFRPRIKEVIYNNDLLFLLYYRFLFRPTDKLDLYLNKISRKHLNFIQIGANDGLVNDPFYKFIRRDNWKGILIEPQKDVFQKLQRTHAGNDQLTLANFAIGE